MTLPEDIPTIAMSPPRFASLNSDIIEVRPQFPANNRRFVEPHSALEQPNSFKRARIYENSHFNGNGNAFSGPPLRMSQPVMNRGTSRMFYKTRICVNFRFGQCRNGENCNFAHGADDIRQPPPNWQELVGSRSEERVQIGGNWEEDQKIILKMKLCKRYYNGEECPYGDNCSFLHEDPAKFRDDSWKLRGSSAISIGTIGSPKPFGDGSNGLEGNRVGSNGLESNRVGPNGFEGNRVGSNGFEGNRVVGKPARGAYWKTKLCLKWQNTGSCPFRDDCHFAHGEAELQAPGGGIEAEPAVSVAKSTKASIPTLPKDLSVSANVAPAIISTSLPVAKEEGKAKKDLLKSKLSKINLIYGDWIDDLPLASCSSQLAKMQWTAELILCSWKQPATG